MYIMSRIFEYALAVLGFCAFASCSGTVDVGEPAVEPEPEDGLRIYADKTEISADGNEQVTFTVKLDGEDVSGAKSMQLVRIFEGEDKYMAYGVNKFSTATAGTYTFRAKYRYGTSYESKNEVKIVARPYFSGAEKNYRRRFFGTVFTSTGCNSCPMAAQGLKKLQEDNPGDITIASFHADMNVKDPMTVEDGQKFNLVLGGETGLPSFYWNMRPESHTGGSVFGESLRKEKEAYETYCGVAVDTRYDAASRLLDISLGITSNKPSVFRYIVILVEDNISSNKGKEYEQAGVTGKEYIHNNVVRKALTAPLGDKMNDNLPVTVGVEVKASRSYTLSEDWNPENMRVIVAATTSGDGGETWVVNNVNECKVGDKSDYIYAE